MMTATRAAARGRGLTMTDADARDVRFDVGRAFDEHGSDLLGFAVNALRDRPLAEDCVQEVFLRAWRARDRYDAGKASERTWLFAIARNVIADALTAAARAPLPQAEETLAERPAPSVDPLERLAVAEALASLSPAHRDVLVAVHVQGLSYQEHAERTGVPMATLRSRAFYALRALREHFERPEADMVPGVDGQPGVEGREGQG